jgi:hypothetical protein
VKLRHALGLLALTALIALAGCGALSALLPGIDLEDGVPIQCVAHYAQVGPQEEVGFDRCGNYWMRSWASGDTVCTIWDEDRGHLRIQCPAERDTL